MESTEQTITSTYEISSTPLWKSLNTEIQQSGGCIVLGINATIPWNNPNNLISAETEYQFDRIKSAVLIPILYLIGLPANCLNMMVFYRQGLKQRVILCLFSLALVDVIYLSVLFMMYAERIYTQFTTGERYGPVYTFLIDKNLIGLYGFAYASMFLSAILSCERCFCVLFPLKSQTMLTTRTMSVIIILGVCISSFLRFAVTAQYRLACFYEMKTNQTTMQIYVNDYYFENRKMIQVLNGVFYGFILSLGCPLVVLITTTITAIKLQQTIKWRRQTSTNFSNKELGLTKMLMCLSAQFFILSIPYIILRVTSTFVPKLNSGSDYGNAFLALISLAELCSYTSSSANFFVNYCAGSRYRETLHEILKIKKQPKSQSRTDRGHSSSVKTIA